MIEVKVTVILDFIPLVGGSREQTVQIEENASILGLIDQLIVMYGEKLRNKLFNESKDIRPEIAMFLNGRNVFALDGLNTKLSLGDEILIFPPVGGG
ncbi:ubiquitin-like small modifier protein 1 [Petroclostridium sp. X23]|uniref:ubiquitin-like small modifier protein 1 n=1 Tax=Petroclostridium sp. X23 TaxID=3045146 RepID=UPI0024AE49F9|nr:ubiquitin-like small modifier protein 1 [Petroclostridium sp. X23]WHH60808.1 MoaD family protein [Petroclostridium sp. X23]